MCRRVECAIMFWNLVNIAMSEEICNAKEFQGRCHGNQVISMTTALYGRMRLGKCVENDLGYLGCQNDVLFLADRWCSGRQTCNVMAGNDELVAANTNCVKGIMPYLEMDYQCIPAQPAVNNCETPNPVSTGLGKHLSSHVTNETGCGSHKAPWVIEAQRGQTIDLWLLDFSALERPRRTLSSCPETYGYVQELSVNITICGDHVRRKQVYTSQTNRLVVTLVRHRGPSPGSRFLLQYTASGCSDAIPPAHAWYRREGSEAVIGCKSDDRVWRLRCSGNTWEGKAGNCSNEGLSGKEDSLIKLEFQSVVLLTGVVCAAVLLVIMVVVAGTVYIKKQSIRHDVQLKSEYSAATWPRDPTYAKGRESENKGQGHGSDDHQPLVRIWDNTMASPAPNSNHATGCDVRIQ